MPSIAKLVAIRALFALLATVSWDVDAQNQPPTVSMAQPANNSTYPPGQTIGLTAYASDIDGSIASIQFFANGALLATTVEQWWGGGLYYWQSVPAGTYSITAVATDNLGASTTSAPITVLVDLAYNHAPTAEITAPASNSVYTPGVGIPLYAHAADSDGNVIRLEFFANGTLVGTVTGSWNDVNRSVLWPNVVAGAYSVTVKATDNLGASTTSAPITVLVDPANNKEPSVQMTIPANNSVYTPGQTVAFQAHANDQDGTIATIEFFANGTLVGTATGSGSDVTRTVWWTNVSAGTYSVTARATDNLGASTTSAPINIAVNTLPTVSLTSPASNSGFFSPASIALTANAVDPEGIARVEFYQGTTLVGTATSSPYTFAWIGVAAGTYSLTAKATDTFGAVATSTAVNIVVNPNTPPTVSLTSPSNGASFYAPASIAITAAAADADGTVAKVDFYQGTTLLGTATTVPYSFNWANVALGNYSVTAVATDDHGATTTSAAVSITVGTAAAQIYYIETDHLNTPRSISNQAGNEVWRWDNTEPFGDSTPDGNPSGIGAFEFNLRFPGQYFDKETNVNYNMGRDYAPNSGRYIESDPIGLLGGLNTYSYAFAAPTSNVDPMGLKVTGQWVEYPHPENIHVDLSAHEERDKMPDIQWRLKVLPYWVFFYVDARASAAIHGKIQCTDDCTSKQWTLDIDKNVKSPTLSKGVGVYMLPPLGWRGTTILLLANIATWAWDYRSLISSANAALALEIAKIAADPTLYCAATSQ